MLTRFAARSISIVETEALANLFSMNLRIRKSSCKSVAKSFSAYHFASQSRMIPTRNPVGLTFDPRVIPPYLADTTIVMWLVRLLIGEAEPLARGRNRFKVGPSLT